MILEDEPEIGSFYKKKLTAAGYEVEWAQTSEAAERLASTFSADLVLVDHGLRGSAKLGLQVLPELKKALPKAHFWFLSNFNDIQVKEQALQSGAEEYLLKINSPPEILIQKMKKLFAKDNK